MKRALLAGVAIAAALGAGGLAQAQTLFPAPPAVDTHGPDLTIKNQRDPALHYIGHGMLIYDLSGNKMVNCTSAGVPAAGSVGAAAPFHPCR
jgi:hypothetical protein